MEEIGNTDWECLPLNINWNSLLSNLFEAFKQHVKSLHVFLILELIEKISKSDSLKKLA